MRFRLTYEGPLKPTQRDARGHEPDKLALHKHNDIRRKFHGQLKRLWETNKFLSEHRVFPSDYNIERPIGDRTAHYGSAPPDSKMPLFEAIATQRENQAFGYRFVPLVRDGVSLLCSVDILFLRRDIPGSVIEAGDIDNRIKTLIDGLRRPQSDNEMPKGTEPRDGEDPFFCLLSNDKHVSHFSVETDTLLDPMSNEDADQRRVRLVITVELRPYHVTSFNAAFL
jgi:hypothetical protein